MNSTEHGLPVSQQLDSAVSVSLAADTDFSSARSGKILYVGTAGNLKVDLVKGGTTITYIGVLAGQFLPIRVSKVYSTANGTTAADIVAHG